jgi:hypothetical protein
MSTLIDEMSRARRRSWYSLPVPYPLILILSGFSFPFLGRPTGPSATRIAQDAITRLESETSEAGHRLRLSKENLRKARSELSTLLTELTSGQSRYPLPGFDPIPAAAANGLASAPTSEAEPAPQRRGKGRRKETTP